MNAEDNNFAHLCALRKLLKTLSWNWVIGLSRPVLSSCQYDILRDFDSSRIGCSRWVMNGCHTGKEGASEASSSGGAGDALGLGYASEDSDAEGAPDSAAGASIANPAEPPGVEPEPEPPTTAHAAAGTDSQGAEAAGEEVAPAAIEAGQAQAETAQAQQSMETPAVAPRLDIWARGDAGGAGTAGMGQGERSEPAAEMTGSEPPAPDAASAGDAVDGTSVAERLVGAPPGSGAGQDDKGPAGFIGPQAPENGSLAAPMAFLKGDRRVPLRMLSL